VPDSGVIDGNRDGNVRSQRQAGTTTGSPTLLLNWDELAIRFNWKAKVGSSILPWPPLCAGVELGRCVAEHPGSGSLTDRDVPPATVIRRRMSGDARQSSANW